MTDTAKIEAAAKAFNEGDRRSFGIVFDALSTDVYRYVGYRIEDESDREEIVSDVFFKILRSGKLPEDFESIRRFAYTVARNAVIDRYRSKKFTDDLDDADAMGKAAHSEDHGSRIDDRAAIGKVLGYLDTVNPEYKEILILRIWDDLAYEDISRITGKSVDNCKKIVSRLLENVRSNVAYLFFFALLIR